MPNWVTNRVTFKDVKVLEKYLTKDEETEGVVLDFQKIIPMPADLEMQGRFEYANPNSQFPDMFGKLEKQAHLRELLEKLFEEVNGKDLSQDDFTELAITNKEIVDELYKVFTSDFSEKDLEEVPLRKDNSWGNEYCKDYNGALDCAVRGFYNCKQYGDIDWWHWRVRHWGTKWTLNEDSVWYEEGNDCIDFETAWAMPDGILKKLAEETDIRVAFADEDLCSSNCGIVEFKLNKETGEVEEIPLLVPEDMDPKFVTVLNTAIHGNDMVEFLEDEYNDYVDEEGNPLYSSEEDKEIVENIYNTVESYMS